MDTPAVAGRLARPAAALAAVAVPSHVRVQAGKRLSARGAAALTAGAEGVAAAFDH